MNLKIFCDGGSRGNPGPAASAFVVLNEAGEKIHSEGIFLGIQTNNFAEYSAVLFAMEWLSKSHLLHGVSSATFVLDSLLVVNQLNGLYKIKSKPLMEFAAKIKRIENEMIIPVIFSHVQRVKNEEADRLVNDSLDINQF